MAKRVAASWLAANARPEYRLVVYASSTLQLNLPGMLRAFRDGKTKLGSVTPISDIGLDETPESISLRSSDRDTLVALDAWFVKKGYDTSGIW